MERTSTRQARHARAKVPAVFLMHQSFAAWGALLTAPWVLLFLCELAWHLGWKTYFSQAQWVLYGTPFFPAQLSIALICGWVAGGVFRHRSMLWVWILPFLSLSSVILGTPPIMDAPMAWSVYPPIDHLMVAQYAQLDFAGRLHHLFGWGTGIQPFNQVAVTLPFYSATAYSLGALLAQKVVRLPTFFASVRNLRVSRLVLCVALPWFCIKVALIWRPTAERYPAMRTWQGLLFILEPFLVISILLAFCFGIAVSCLGQRFFLTRFFLNPIRTPGSTQPGDLVEQPHIQDDLADRRARWSE